MSRHRPQDDIRLAQMVVGRMRAENAANTSDEEIERTLARCVGGLPLVGEAKRLRNTGLIQPDLTLKLRHKIECPSCGFESIFVRPVARALCARCNAYIQCPDHDEPNAA